MDKKEALVVVQTQLSQAVRHKFDPNTGVKRGLKTRHISMMALAGIVGPGVFIGMGSALRDGGPAGLIVGFTIVGVLVMIMMFCIGELNSLFDFNFNTHASRWVDPSFGAAMGWYYVFLWVCSLIAEYVSVISVMSFYSDKVPLWGYYLILWGAFSIYQMVGVDIFGEVEYILAFIKLLFITGFYLFSVIYAAGGIKGHSPGNPFKNFPLNSGFKGIANSFVYAGVYYTGIESLSVTFSELRNVRAAVKNAVRQAVVRIFYVYFGIIISYGITVPYTDPGLSGSNKTMKSPMTIALVDAGWKNAGFYVSTVVLITSLSSINSAIYYPARSLKRLADDGYAPKVFSKVTTQGVPWVATHTVHLFGFLSILSIKSSSSVAYGYIINLAGLCAFIVWSGIIFVHLRFRAGWYKLGRTDDELPYKAPFYPYANYIGIVLGIALTLVQGWSVFVPFNAGNFVDVYIMIPFFFIVWGGFKLYLKSLWIRYEHMDFVSDRQETDGVYTDVESLGSQSTQEKKKESFASKIWNSI
ncbi:CIC11C00000001207 [Sungouiella intermedia]|uniref:CIC11C00000001207 n=1 Tax=Sungouiella intermedia TaxID=45354 RepID=A0A1L0DGZ5_9ASCO|nr:CIC11C00000001207 [[Candida] intermedia]